MILLNFATEICGRIDLGMRSEQLRLKFFQKLFTLLLKLVNFWR